jgi:hypothetical protein
VLSSISMCSMSYVIYDLEGSNDANPQGANLIPVGELYFPCKYILGAGTVWGWGSSLHSGIEFGRSRTGKGSSGGRKKGVV